MSLDLISSIELTGSAAITIAVSSIILGATPPLRLRLAGIFILWFCAVALLGGSNAFGPQHRIGTPLLGLSVLAPIALITLSVRKLSSLNRSLTAAPLSWLIALNILRVIGVSFLLLKNEGRVAPTFASIAGWGDIIAGILAAPLAWATARGSVSRSLILFWNAYGLLDLVAAVGLGVASSEGPLRVIFEPASSAVMTTLPWLFIPGFLVPVLASSHLAIFWKLRRSPARAPQAPTSTGFSRA